MSAELNSKTGAQSGSMDADACGPESLAGEESEVSVTQAQPNIGSVCDSSAAESVASGALLSFPSSDDAVCSGSRARAVTSAISYAWPDDRSRSCSSWWPGTAVMGSNPSKIKSPQISTTKFRLPNLT